MESFIQANPAEQAALAAAGFTFEYPGFWQRVDQTAAGHERSITIADGKSCNGYMWEVQIAIDDDTQVATEGFGSVEEALAMVEREIAQAAGCEECARSHGPHYTGPCEH